MKEEKDKLIKQIPNKDAIPCVFLPYALGSSKIMLYFHGNAEDIGLATELLDYIRTLMRVNLLYYNFRFMLQQWNTLVMVFMMGHQMHKRFQRMQIQFITIQFINKRFQKIKLSYLGDQLAPDLLLTQLQKIILALYF